MEEIKSKKYVDDVLEIDWNGVGAHTNYSTKSMREEGGYEIIKMAIGLHETADINTFKWIHPTLNSAPQQTAPHPIVRSSSSHGCKVIFPFMKHN
ncbi:hypothetical protein Tco_0761989 [Tanacetum coccineum]